MFNLLVNMKIYFDEVIESLKGWVIFVFLLVGAKPKKVNWIISGLLLKCEHNFLKYLSPLK